MCPNDPFTDDGKKLKVIPLPQLCSLLNFKFIYIYQTIIFYHYDYKMIAWDVHCKGALLFRKHQNRDPVYILHRMTYAEMIPFYRKSLIVDDFRDGVCGTPWEFWMVKVLLVATFAD